MHDQAAAGQFTVIYAFQGNSGSPPAGDGAAPYGPLAIRNGVIYGTTVAGGVYDTTGSNAGTVYSVSTGGKEKVLHSFGGPGDGFFAGSTGSFPASGVILVNGVIYGTANGGLATCSGGCGIAYRIMPSGNEAIIHKFGKGYDGANPEGQLVQIGPLLYGATVNGGKYGGTPGFGTLFSLALNGVEKILHSFEAGSADGYHPIGGPILYNNALVGQVEGTGQGGNGIYSVTALNKEKILFSGASVEVGYGVGLSAYSNTLYGVSVTAGEYNDGGVFSLPAAGAAQPTWIHSFGGRNDGIGPALAPPVSIKGVLYGTTSGGAGETGCGTLYEIAPGGKEKVDYQFTCGNDGSDPSYLTVENGIIYGIAQQHGQYGFGSVFRYVR